MDGSVITPDVWVAAAAGLPTLAHSYSRMIPTMNLSRHSETVTLRMLACVAVWNNHGDALRIVLQWASWRGLMQPTVDGVHSSWIGSFLAGPLLSCAARQNSLHAAAALLHVKANVNITTDGYCGRKPLHWAAQRGHVAAAALLIHANAEVDIRSRTYAKSLLETPLMIAAGHGQVSMVCMLLEAGANVDLRCKNDDSALVYAVVSLCSAQDPRQQLLLQEVVVRLLEARADVGLADKSCRTLMWHAAASGRVDTLQLLVQARAPVNTRAGNLVGGDTPLMLAASRGHVRTVQYLLQAKAELTEPLTFSCQNRAGRRILQLLTAAKATV